MKSADRLVLATDPDREGEAISWHVLEVLRKKNVLKDKPVCRVVFNAITKNAISDAMENRARLMKGWSMPIWRAARWIIWSGLTCRPFYGASCPARARQVGCNRLPCA